MPPKFTPEEVERYRRLLGDYADGAMDMFQSMDRKVEEQQALHDLSMEEIERVLAEDQDEKLEHFRLLEQRVFSEVQEAAESWWEKSRDAPDSVGDVPTLKEARTQRELLVKAGKSVEYLHQLYFDAAKAQKRLTSIGELLDQDLAWCTASMPTIKGIARATEKSRMGDETAPDDHAYAAGLRDLARGTIEVTLLTQIIPGVEAFLNKAAAKAPGAEVTRFKNKFKKPDSSGYADIQLHIRLDGGHICEMQFQSSALLDFKSLGGSHRPPKGRAWESWDNLLGSEDTLTEAQRLLGALITDSPDTIIGKPPEDAQKSMTAFAEASTGEWFINAHIIYNITRWFDDKLKLKPTADGAVADEHRATITTVNDKLKAISKAAATGMQKVLNAELGGDGDSTDLYEAELSRLKVFDVPVGPITI